MSSGYVEETWWKHIPDPKDEAPKHTSIQTPDTVDAYSDDEPKRKAATHDNDFVSSPGEASDSKKDSVT